MVAIEFIEHLARDPSQGFAVEGALTFEAMLVFHRLAEALVEESLVDLHGTTE